MSSSDLGGRSFKTSAVVIILRTHRSKINWEFWRERPITCGVLFPRTVESSLPFFSTTPLLNCPCVDTSILAMYSNS